MTGERERVRVSWIFGTLQSIYELSGIRLKIHTEKIRPEGAPHNLHSIKVDNGEFEGRQLGRVSYTLSELYNVLLLEIHRLYSKNSLWVKSVLTPAAARTPSAAAIINCAGVITDASPAAYTP